jgi:hypothetical protein
MRLKLVSQFESQKENKHTRQHSDLIALPFVPHPMHLHILQVPTYCPDRTFSEMFLLFLVNTFILPTYKGFLSLHLTLFEQT